MHYLSSMLFSDLLSARVSPPNKAVRPPVHSGFFAHRSHPHLSREHRNEGLDSVVIDHKGKDILGGHRLTASMAASLALTILSPAIDPDRSRTMERLTGERSDRRPRRLGSVQSDLGNDFFVIHLPEGLISQFDGAVTASVRLVA